MNALIQTIVGNGIPVDLIYFLLTIPLIVTVATFARHMIGLKLLGIYEITTMSIIIGFILKEYTPISLAVGIGLLAFIFFISYFIKKITVHLNLHYFSRISIIISLVSLLLVSVLLVIGRFGEVVQKLKLNEISPFTFVIGVILSESFSSTQTQKGFKKSRVLFMNTLLLSLLIGLLISWNDFQTLILNAPYLTIGFVILTLMFGRYKGIRLLEFLRFTDMKFEKYND
jgi:hypothetical protein